MKRFLFVVLCALMLAGCKTGANVVTVVEYRDRLQKDTIVQHDSVYHSHVIREKGDTVFITDTVLKYKFIDKTRDVYVHDSIPYPVEVQVPVRVRNGYDYFTAWGFWIALAILAIWIALRIWLARRR